MNGNQYTQLNMKLGIKMKNLIKRSNTKKYELTHKNVTVRDLERMSQFSILWDEV